MNDRFHIVTYPDGAAYGCFCAIGVHHKQRLLTPAEVVAEHIAKTLPGTPVYVGIPASPGACAGETDA